MCFWSVDDQNSWKWRFYKIWTRTDTFMKTCDKVHKPVFTLILFQERVILMWKTFLWMTTELQVWFLEFRAKLVLQISIKKISNPSFFHNIDWSSMIQNSRVQKELWTQKSWNDLDFIDFTEVVHSLLREFSMKLQNPATIPK